MQVRFLHGPFATAARVESATRQTGDDVLITEQTRRLLSDDAWVPRPPVPLKGKSEPVALFAPAGPAARPAGDAARSGVGVARP